jgi:small conductance mechanosensitive channel
MLQPEQLSYWTELTLTTGLRLLAIVVFAVLLRRLLRIVTERLVKRAATQTRMAQAREQQTRTLARIAYSTGSAVILLVAVVMALPLIGVNVTPIAAVAGLASVAVGFGAQNLVRDLINGFFIVSEDQFVVGDTIRIGATSGRVEDLSLRRTVLRDPNGALWVIPNGEIRGVANLSRDWSQVFVDIPIAGRAKLDRAVELLDGVCSDFRADPVWAEVLLDGPRVLGVEWLTTSGATVRLAVRTLANRQHDAARELRRRIHSRFEDVGAGL